MSSLKDILDQLYQEKKIEEENQHGDFLSDDNFSGVKVPYVLVLDNSISMDGEPIEQLNKALKEFKKLIKSDEYIKERARVMAISVGGNDINEIDIIPFSDADDFDIAPQKAIGHTSIAKGIKIGLEAVQNERDYLNSKAFTYQRPMMVLVTNNIPNDNDKLWKEAIKLASEEIIAGKVSIFSLCFSDEQKEKIEKLTGTDNFLIFTPEYFMKLFESLFID